MGGLVRLPFRPTTHHLHRSLLTTCFCFSAYQSSEPGSPHHYVSTAPIHRRSASCAPSIPGIDLSWLAPPYLLPHWHHSATVLADDYSVNLRRDTSPLDTFDPFSTTKPSSDSFRPTTSPPDRSLAPGKALWGLALLLTWLSDRPSSRHHPPLAHRYQPLLVPRRTFISSQSRHRSPLPLETLGSPATIVFLLDTCTHAFKIVSPRRRATAAANPSRSSIPRSHAFKIADPLLDTCSHAFIIIDHPAVVHILRDQSCTTT